MTGSSPQRYVRVLTIAGSDSGGGAGIQADLKTFAALGCYGMSAITALTAQNTLGVRSIHAPPPQMLADQIDAVLEDIGADAVKIGMLHSAEIARTVAAALDRHRMTQVVLDPVMVSTSGSRLIDPEAVDAVVAELFPRALLVTPNLDEAMLLTARQLDHHEQLAAAADALLARGARGVLLKGGHLREEQVHDLLALADGGRHWLLHPRIDTRNLHGTGCTLSAAIAAHLALGFGLVEAVTQASDFVHAAIASGADVQLGQGHGPLNHGHAPRVMLKRPL